MAEPGTLDYAADMLRTELECDCGHGWAVKTKLVTPELETVCPACGKRENIDAASVTRIQAEFRNAMANIARNLGLRLDGEPRKKPARRPKKREPKGYPVGLVGESHYQSAIKDCQPGDPVKLLREPRNPHDPNAIAVVDRRWRTLGYIGRSSFVQRLVRKDGQGCTATVLSINENEDGKSNLGVVLDVIICDEPLGER